MVTVDTVKQLEDELERAKQTVSAQLRATRVAKDLSLRDVARRVRLSPSAINNMEQGLSWRTRAATRTAEKLVRFYEKAEKGNGQRKG